MKMFFRILLTPRCWLQNDPYSKAWDRRLNELMGQHKFKLDGDECCVAKIGDLKVWIENHPYSSFTIWRDASGNRINVRPSRATILRAWDKLQHDIISGL